MSDVFNFIDSRKQTSTVLTYFRYSYRSKFLIKNAKHCFETTFNSGCNSYHTGFSPYKNAREFASYISYGSFVEKLKNENEHTTAASISLKQGDTVMSCLDTKQSQIYAIANRASQTYTYTTITKTSTWYAYVDTTSSCSTNNPTNVTINLGMKGFVNDMPEGYLPFITQYYMNIGKQQCTPRSTSHISQYYLVILILS